MWLSVDMKSLLPQISPTLTQVIQKHFFVSKDVFNIYVKHGEVGGGVTPPPNILKHWYLNVVQI